MLCNKMTYLSILAAQLKVPEYLGTICLLPSSAVITTSRCCNRLLINCSLRSNIYWIEQYNMNIIYISIKTMRSTTVQQQFHDTTIQCAAILDKDKWKLLQVF